MTYHHQWLYLRDESDSYEVFNGARTAAYLSSPTSPLGCGKVSNVLDFGGCEAYAFDPPCDDDEVEYLPYSKGYVQFPGISGNYLSAPDSSTLDIVGDITIIARVAAADWTPAGIQTITCKRASGTQNSYRFVLNTAGTLSLITSPDGTDGAQITATSTVPVAAANGEWMWVAATLDVNNGAGGRSTRFWVSADADVPSWTQLGATVTVGATTSIFNSTSPLEVGSVTGGTQSLFVGKISDVYIRAAIGAAGTVPNMRDIFAVSGFAMKDIPPDTLSFFTSSYFTVLTLNRTGVTPAAFVSAVGGGATPPRANHVLFPRFPTSANVLQVPDEAAISAPTQLDVRAVVTRQPDLGSSRVLVAHRDDGANGFAWALSMSSFERLLLQTSTSGVAASATSAASTATLPANEEMLAVRATWRSSDGRTQFFTKPTTPDTIDADLASNTDWTQLGVNATASTAALFNSTGTVRIGNGFSAVVNAPWLGGIYALSVATTIDGAPWLQIGTQNWPRVDDMPSFAAATGQTVSITRAASGPALDFVFAEFDNWDVLHFVDPETDDAPWYSADIDESADLLGFYVEEWTGLDNGHTKRQVTRTGRPGGGGQLGVLGSAERVMKLNVLVLGASERALEYGMRWLSGRLGNVCASCSTSSMLIRRFCPAISEDLWNGVAELREVGLIEDVTWENEPVERAGCFIRRLSFTLAAGDPCMYLEPSDGPLVVEGDASMCYDGLPIADGKATCRPMCVDLPEDCRSVFSFDVPAAVGAVAPVLTLSNESDHPVPPLRLIAYADPHDEGVSPNPCGLPILGEIYTQVIPPWTEIVWDVTARKVLYSDHTTVGLEGGFRLMDAVDPPHQRFFALPCGPAHIVVEPATTCLTVDTPNSRYTYNGYSFLWSELHFPAMSLQLQERIGCA